MKTNIYCVRYANNETKHETFKAALAEYKSNAEALELYRLDCINGLVKTMRGTAPDAEAEEPTVEAEATNEPNKVAFSLVAEAFYTYNENHKGADEEPLKAAMVIKQSSFTKEYSLESRTYTFTSNNKYFKAWMGGNSLFGECLDGSESGVRLDYYIGDSWEIDYCYFINEEDNGEDKQTAIPEAEELAALKAEVAKLEDLVLYLADGRAEAEEEAKELRNQVARLEGELAEERKESERYDYRREIAEDVEYYYEHNEDAFDGLSKEEIKEKLYDDCFVADDVTGNASGSYTFNSWRAEKNLCGNWDLLADALEEFGNDYADLSKGAEWADVTIRCYLLADAVSEFVDGLERWQVLTDGENECDGYYKDESAACCSAICTIEAELYALRDHISQEDFAELEAEARKAYYNIENYGEATFYGKIYEIATTDE